MWLSSFLVCENNFYLSMKIFIYILKCAFREKNWNFPPSQLLCLSPESRRLLTHVAGRDLANRAADSVSRCFEKPPHLVGRLWQGCPEKWAGPGWGARGLWFRNIYTRGRDIGKLSTNMKCLGKRKEQWTKHKKEKLIPIIDSWLTYLL